MGVLQPQLGGYKQRFTLHTALLKGIAHLGFILIGGGGINQTIAGLNGIDNVAFTFLGVRHLEDTKTQFGHFDPVVQLHCLHVVVLLFLCEESITQRDLFD